MTLVEYVTQTVWGLEPRVHANLVQLVLAHAAGQRVDAERIEEIVAARDKGKERDLPSAYENRDGVGIVPVSGVIARHARQVNGMSQPRGTSLEQIRADLQAAFADDSAHSVMLAIDSPGGSVDGIVDFTDDLRAMRKASGKPLVAHVAGNAASLAYWIAAQADKVMATRGSHAGSIGARATLIDDHRRLETAGLSVVHVGSTRGKVEGPQMGSAIGPHEIAAVQGELAQWHARFVDAVATGRKVAPEIAADWAKDSAMFDAAKAVELGLIDAIATEASAIESLRKAADRRRVAATNKPGKNEMQAQNEGGAVAVAPANPTSAHDLRAAYPEAVQQIEREAIHAERERVATIANAAANKPDAVVRAGLDAIRDGRNTTDALVAMLGVASAPLATTNAAATQSATANVPTLRTFATAQVQPLGAAPLPEQPPAQARKPRYIGDARKEWDAMPYAQRAEFGNDFAAFAAATGGTTLVRGS